jgi:DNA replication protein DnaC
MHQIESSLKELHLQGMGRAWQSITETGSHHKLSLSEGLALMLQSERELRRDNRFDRLRKAAGFRYAASIEEINCEASRGITQSQMAEYASGAYIKKAQSILITGATGCGKSYIASALGHQACGQGYKVKYFNFQKLLLALKIARLDGSIYKLFDQLEKADLLILDDFGLTCLESGQQPDLMEIIEDRHAKRSTIIASQLPVSKWYEIISEATIADAILDRLVHTSHRIELKGESLRKKM